MVLIILSIIYLAMFISLMYFLYKVYQCFIRSEEIFDRSEDRQRIFNDKIDKHLKDLRRVNDN